MLYYIFKPVVGNIYPQVRKMSPGYNYNATNSVHALSRQYQHLPDFIPDLNYFVVHGKSTLTDLLSVSVTSGGFLISERLKKVFEKFSLPIHEFYLAQVKFRKQFYDYYWMHVSCDLTNAVDFKKSKFFIYYNYCHNLGYIDINSEDDFLQKKNKIKEDNKEKTITIWAEKICLNHSFDKKIDLFEIGQFDANYYISERLKNAIINANINGVKIIPTGNILIE